MQNWDVEDILIEILLHQYIYIYIYVIAVKQFSETVVPVTQSQFDAILSEEDSSSQIHNACNK